MITVLYGEAIYRCEYAEKSDHTMILYDENRNIIMKVENLYGDEWDFISIIDGEWEELPPEPTPEELLQEKLDHLQADLDYCLMLLDE